MDNNYTSFGQGLAAPSRTVGDLYDAVMVDAGLSAAQKQEMIAAIRELVGYGGNSVSLDAVLRKGGGGVVGYLISRYFKMGPVGQFLAAFTGYGIGSAIHNAANKPAKMRSYIGFR